MKNLSLNLLIIFFCVISTNVFAQTEQDKAKNGSFYSLFGLGLPVDGTSAQEKAMGIYGISFNDLDTPGLGNPAFWSRGNLTRATAGFGLSSISGKDNSGSNKNASLAAGHFHTVFPIKAGKMGMSVALYPVTRSSFRNLNESEFVLAQNDSLFYSVDERGIGGTTKFELGFAYTVSDFLSVGYAPAFTFLSESSSSYVKFESSSFSDSRIDTKIRASAFAHRFGAQFIFRNIASNNDLLLIGGTLNLPVNLEAKQSSSTLKRGLNANLPPRSFAIGDTTESSVSLPLEYGLGVSYFPSVFFNASLEAQMQQWGSTEYGFDATEESLLSNRFRIGLGTQLHPYRHNSNKFLSKFKYSNGISYDTGHLTFGDDKISTLWLSAGIGILSTVNRSRSSVDLSFQYGIRGTTSNNLVRENIWALNLSVNLTELMFIRPKFN